MRRHVLMGICSLLLFAACRAEQREVPSGRVINQTAIAQETSLALTLQAQPPTITPTPAPARPEITPVPTAEATQEATEEGEG